MAFDFTKIKKAAVTNWPMKLTALALAAVLWAAVSAQQPTTQLVPVTLEVQAPPGRTLTQALPQVHAVYSGSARELVKLYTSPPFIRKTIPDTLTVSTATIELSPQDLTLTEDAGVSAQDILPRRIVVSLDSVFRRTVPVVHRVTVRADSGFELVGEISVSPARVVLSGTEEDVQRVRRVFTTSLQLPPLRAPARQLVTLDTSGLGNLRISRRTVEVAVNVTPLTERFFLGVPVTVETDQDGTWQSIPAEASVVVRGPLTRLIGLTLDSLPVIAVAPTTGDSARVGLLVRGPPGLTVSTGPDSVMVRRAGDG
jgi:hypothetical protein